LVPGLSRGQRAAGA